MRRSLLSWWPFLEGSKIPFQIWIDYKNLEALKTPCKLSPKQARWVQHFQLFHFTLCYLLGGGDFLAILDAIIPLLQSRNNQTNAHQLATQVTTRSQQREKLPVSSDMTSAIKKALTDYEWFCNHNNVCSN